MALSLVIPTYNRGEKLRLLLDSLKAQTLPADQWEAVLVDDGSEAPHRAAVETLLAEYNLPIRPFFRENRGPAVARNDGVAQARHDVVLFLNDDLELAPRHLERHATFHRDHPAENAAAHGETRWAESAGRTPVMECLRRWTFNYDIELTEWEQPLVRFCTSSLSVKRTLLLRHPFNEQFREPSFEDTELGYRLVREEGLTVETLLGDPALHHHPHTGSQLLRRAAMNGRNAPIMIATAPEFLDRLITPFMTPPPRLRELRALLLYIRGDRAGFWREMELAAFVRAYWRAMAR